MSECLDCAKGKYQPERGKNACLDCDAGKYLDARGSVGSGDCKLCPVNSGNNAAGSQEESWCKCNPGSAGADGGPACTLCAPGRYQAGIGEAECVCCAAGKKLPTAGSSGEGDCTECEAGLISSEGAANCRACDLYAQRVGAALQKNCECNVGFYRFGVDFASYCTLCESGKYKTEVGNAEALCQQCPDSSGDAAAQMCQRERQNPDSGNEGGNTGGGGGGVGGGVVGGAAGIIVILEEEAEAGPQASS